jgi:dihydroxyacid dehydratase/phosphogluconate dehydratase
MTTALAKAMGNFGFPGKKRVGWGSRFAMDAKTNIKKRLPSRHVTEGPERAPRRRPRDIVTRRSLQNAAAVVAVSGGATNAALHLPAIVHECGIKFDLFDVAEIFKKTPYVADLKSGGRYVAKDMFEVGGIPLLIKTLLDNGHLHGDRLTVTGRTIAEIDADVGTLNVKLTGAELAERKTKWKARETNHTSGALWKYAQQVGPAVDGAVTHPGGAHEKQCYADI